MEPPSCDLKGSQPPRSSIFLEIRAYKNHYSVVKGYFRLKAIEQPSFHKIEGIKLRCLLDDIIIFLCKYVELSSKFLIKRDA